VTARAPRGGKARVDGEVLDWLLDESDPSIRLFALTRLLGESGAGAKAVAARKAVMEAGPAAEILALQNERGYWGEGPDFYTDKYGGTVWQLLALAELGAEGRDPRIAAACEYLFEHSQDPESGGFSIESAARGGGRHSMVVPCLTGNMVFSLIRLGYGRDERVMRAINYILAYQRADDGEGRPPSGWPYDRLSDCFGAHSCFMGAAKALKGLAAIPAAERSPEVEAKLGELAEFFLLHRIYKKSREPSKVSKPGWLKFGFPLMYQTDALELLCILKDLGVEDPRMGEAKEAVAAKRGKNGRWRLENSFNGKTLVDIEAKGEDSKWITARSLYVLGD
jgi:hypothetical protein